MRKLMMIGIMTGIFLLVMTGPGFGQTRMERTNPGSGEQDRVIPRDMPSDQGVAPGREIVPGGQGEMDMDRGVIEEREVTPGTGEAPTEGVIPEREREMVPGGQSDVPSEEGVAPDRTMPPSDERMSPDQGRAPGGGTERSTDPGGCI